MHIRALVQVHEHRKTHYNQGQTAVIMHPVHAGDKIPEAQRFSAATPSGELTLLMIDSVAGEFALGKYLQVDFTEAPTE
jgi:hypothetical protein